jgi:type II secretory pathway pseudopilin PulG
MEKKVALLVIVVIILLGTTLILFWAWSSTVNNAIKAVVAISKQSRMCQINYDLLSSEYSSLADYGKVVSVDDSILVVQNDDRFVLRLKVMNNLTDRRLFYTNLYIENVTNTDGDILNLDIGNWYINYDNSIVVDGEESVSIPIVIRANSPVDAFYNLIVTVCEGGSCEIGSENLYGYDKVKILVTPELTFDKLV